MNNGKVIVWTIGDDSYVPTAGDLEAFRDEMRKFRNILKGESADLCAVFQHNITVQELPIPDVITADGTAVDSVHTDYGLLIGTKAQLERWKSDQEK